MLIDKLGTRTINPLRTEIATAYFPEVLSDVTEEINIPVSVFFFNNHREMSNPVMQHVYRLQKRSNTKHTMSICVFSIL